MPVMTGLNTVAPEAAAQQRDDVATRSVPMPPSQRQVTARGGIPGVPSATRLPRPRGGRAEDAVGSFGRRPAEVAPLLPGQAWVEDRYRHGAVKPAARRSPGLRLLAGLGVLLAAGGVAVLSSLPLPPHPMAEQAVPALPAMAALPPPSTIDAAVPVPEAPMAPPAFVEAIAFAGAVPPPGLVAPPPTPLPAVIKRPTAVPAQAAPATVAQDTTSPACRSLLQRVQLGEAMEAEMRGMLQRACGRGSAGG